MPSAAQNRAGLGRWEPGFVDEIGESPTIRAECGDVVRFAYRNVKRMGKPKRIVHTGDRVEFIRPLVCEPGCTAKAVHVRLIEIQAGEPLPPSQLESIPLTGSKSLMPWAGFPSSSTSSDASDDGSSVGGTDSSSSCVSTCCSSTEWRRHDPYSWEGTWTMTVPPAEGH